MAKQLIKILRNSGRCPSSILPSEDTISEDDNFWTALTNIHDVSGLSFRSDIDISQNFQAIIEMTDSTLINRSISSHTLSQRRGIILTLIGGTNPESQVLKHILDSGFLNNLKSWLDDILQSKVG